MDLRALEPWNDEARPTRGPDGQIWRAVERTFQVPEHGMLVTRNRLIFRDAEWNERAVLCDQPLWSLSEAALELLCRRAFLSCTAPGRERQA